MTTIPIKRQYVEEYATKSKIASILNIRVSNSWIIEDEISDKGLYLVHYNDKRQGSYIDPNYSHLRGYIVDLTNNRLLVDSSGYIASAVVDTFSPKENILSLQVEDELRIYDLNKIENKRWTNFSRGHEGINLRIFKYNGVVYRSGYRRIDTSKSRVLGKLYSDYWKELGGPTNEELFDKNSNNSSICYIFTMVIPQNTNYFGSRLEIGKGYIVYEGKKNISTKGDNGLFDVNTLVPDIELYNKKPIYGKVYGITQLKDEVEINNFLTNGWIRNQNAWDERLNTGEYVVMEHLSPYYYRNDNGDLVERLHLETIQMNSVSFNWRLSMRAKELSVERRFYMLLSQAIRDKTVYTDKQAKKYIELLQYPLLDIDIEAILPMYSHPKGVLDQIKTIDGRINNLYLNYLLSLPPHEQFLNIDLIKKIENDKNMLVNFLYDAYNDNSLIDEMTNTNRTGLKSLISSSIKENNKPLLVALKDTVENLMGETLLRYVKDVRAYYNKK